MSIKSVVAFVVIGLLLTSDARAQGTLNVIATTEDLAAIAREVGGDRITVDSLAKGYQDPHFVEAKPSFILKLQKADLLIVVGRELEIGWLPPLIQQSRNAKIQAGADAYLDASVHAKILDIPQGQITRAMGDVHPSGNPHYWLDPENGKVIARDIAAKLAQYRPGDKAYFDQRLADFTNRLNDGVKRWLAAMAPFKGVKVVTYHRSYPNFVDRFGLDVIGYVEPRPGIPPSPGHTLDLIQEMKRQGIKVILMEPYFDQKTPNSIASQTGAKVLVLPPSVGGEKSITDYIKLFDFDVNMLVTALKDVGAKGAGYEAAMQLDAAVLEFLKWPFLASLVIAGIHAYLGVHVVERGVIFVDLSLAQIAAFGATIALLLPISDGDPHGPAVYWVSLAFTFLGAVLFSTIRSQKARIPQEAIIGIAYAVASAATILAMSKATSEGEHLKDMLVGNILAVSSQEVLTTAGLYVLLGIFHYVFRRRFLLISLDPARAEAEGVSIRLWDFLFYMSFGFVVTRSVAIAGVLLVFCYLIVPSVAAMLYADRIGPRLAIGWTMGTVVSALGVYFSLWLDLPTGATIVCTFGGVLVLMALARPLVRARATSA